MTKVIATIGSMYGDEGKGLMVDYFAYNNPNSIVIRHNGGSNAGHTVQTPEGKRHIFSHFGSGSFLNIPTYLSEFFVCNPLQYTKEKATLTKLCVFPTLIVHPDSLVTTPFDMIINLVLESRRGNNKHGSCGIGFGETIARSQTHKKLTVKDLATRPRDYLRNILVKIRSEYVADRFRDQPLDRDTKSALDYNSKSDAYWLSILHNNDLIEDWLDAADTFIKDIIVSNYNIITDETIIFEGAQGLMLDQRSPDFPHVTRSNTGIKNIITILKNMQKKNQDFEIEDFEVVYVSRAYTTRHGAGPLDFEQKLPYNIIDQTNIPNENQGKMRFAPLLFDKLNSVIQHDVNQLDENDTNFNARLSMAFTCLDQIGPTGFFVTDDTLTSVPRKDMIELLTKSSTYTSFGPTRDDIKAL